MIIHDKNRGARLWVTTSDQQMLLTEQPVPPSGANDASVLHINEHDTDQTMDGFGAALTDSSAWLISRMPAAKREALLRELFHPTQGLGFSVLRLPMGASDFAVNGSYTYHDLPPGVTDPKLTRFSIAHDKAYILPLLRRIKQINPSLKIVASPWTAPAWMKTNRGFNGGWLDWPAYDAYARYFVKFLEGYRAEGVPIWAVTVQNEPRNENKSYPTMRMEPRDQARFVRDHLGPAMQQAGLSTKIFVWDHNWDAPEYPIAVLNDAAARRYIAGVAFHAYAGQPSAQAKVRHAFPATEIHFTESSGGDWAPGFGGNLRWDVENLIIGSTRYGSRSVLKWNLALDENHGPTNGGCMNCRGVVTVNPQTGDITRNSEYYAFGHGSKFVRPGAVRLVTGDISGLSNVAFRNPDGTHALIVCNSGTSARPLTVRGAESSFRITLPAQAVATLHW